MRQATSNEMAAVSLTVAQGLGVWLAVVPKLESVRAADVNDDTARIALHHSEMVVGTITLATGAIGSVMLKSPLPLISAAVIITALAVAYEMTLKTEIVQMKGNTDD